MADDQDFSLLTVSGDNEEDDVVIQAGVVSQPAEQAKEPVEDRTAVLDQADVSAKSARYKGVSEETAALLDEADDEARAEFARHMKDKHEREATAYVTTEEDLHAKGPYRNMRIWILIAAALFVIAFIVYWNVSFGA